MLIGQIRKMNSAKMIMKVNDPSQRAFIALMI